MLKIAERRTRIHPAAGRICMRDRGAELEVRPSQTDTCQSPLHLQTGLLRYITARRSILRRRTYAAVRMDHVCKATKFLSRLLVLSSGCIMIMALMATTFEHVYTDHVARYVSLDII